MLQTIEVEIDAKGHIHPLEKFPLPAQGFSRALLTLLPTSESKTKPLAASEACGVLHASRSVSLEEMAAAVRLRGVRL